MFSFIKKFFEHRRALAAEREQECSALIKSIDCALAECKDCETSWQSYLAWCTKYESLRNVFLNDSVKRFKKCSSFRLLTSSADLFVQEMDRIRERIDFLRQNEECPLLLSKLNECFAKINFLFSNSAEYISDDAVSSWRKKRQENINMLSCHNPNMYSKASCYSAYKKSWEQFFSVLDSLSQKVKVHNE